MHDALQLGLLALVTAGAGMLAVHSHHVAQRLRIPTPALFLVAAALAVRYLPGLDEPDHKTLEWAVSVALALILFDGGLHIGARRFRQAARGILVLGLLGTLLTVAGAAVVAHSLLGLSWYLSLLVATAVSPTDPAVVFSVLGQREIEGSTGTLLEGESGANDPVGIALMAGILGAGSLSGGALLHVAGTFVLQMVVGLLVGVVGGRALLGLMRRVPLPAEGLYLLRALLGTGLLFGTATLLHGSGFLAVFVAGIVIGDERAPYKREIERFQSALASLGEIIAFALLGFTVHLDVLGRLDVWLPGLVLGLVLAVLVRPLLVGPLLLPFPLRRGEVWFVLLAGLKGAVPLLLGSQLVGEHEGQRLYHVVVVVVMVSVLLQGSTVPTLAARLGIRMRTVEPEPFSLGVRLRDEPRNALRLTVSAGSRVDGCAVADVPDLMEGSWISLVLRDGVLVAPRGDTVLRAGDEVLLLLDEEQEPGRVVALF